MTSQKSRKLFERKHGIDASGETFFLHLFFLGDAGPHEDYFDIRTQDFFCRPSVCYHG